MSLKCTKVLQENSARTTLANSEISMPFFDLNYVKLALRNVFHCQLFKETAGLVYKRLIPKVTDWLEASHNLCHKIFLIQCYYFDGLGILSLKS